MTFLLLNNTFAYTQLTLFNCNNSPSYPLARLNRLQYSLSSIQSVSENQGHSVSHGFGLGSSVKCGRL